MFYDLFKDYSELKAEILASSCFINDGKGNFKQNGSAAGIASWHHIFFCPFDYNNTNSWLACGNFYGVIPYEGRYDALQPTFFSYDKTDKHHLNMIRNLLH